MDWDEALAGVETVESFGSASQVVGVQYDSRRVASGDIFIAMRGGTVDGNRFINAALASGAVAIVTDSRESFEDLRNQGVTVALVQHGRRALAQVSANLFGHPERQLAVCAVTGTNGKTTTAYLLEQMLRSVSRTCVLLGTIETHVGDAIRISEHTTPEARDLLAVFADGVAIGATEAVMEMSSHALDQERVWGIPVDVAIFTNLTQDHLDYHGTMEAYFEAKARLFDGVGARPPRVAVINTDDETAATLRSRASSSHTMTYGMGKGTHRAENVSLRAGETAFDFVTPDGTISLRSPLTGRVNVYNLMAASCAAIARGLTLEEIARASANLGQVPGRFQVIASRHPDITVVVDYAHTDDALKNLIALARELVEPSNGRVITLFGCGGDRDRTKRPRMGRVAGQGSDLVVVTTDNPRSEDPARIIDEIMLGLRETAADCIIEEDRAGAIEIAIRAARAGDIVLLAGKGHEKIQIFAEGAVPFDDVAVAESVLKEIG